MTICNILANSKFAEKVASQIYIFPEPVSKF